MGIIAEVVYSYAKLIAYLDVILPLIFRAVLLFYGLRPMNSQNH